jgi:pyruvate ferredoxin oxidoreductase delta subunit
VAAQSAQPKWTELAIGTSITYPGSARECKTGDWKSQRPIWNHEQCISCGLCVIYCPEGCVHFGQEQVNLPDANLNYCKGCGICVHECPTACISMKDEEE